MPNRLDLPPELVSLIEKRKQEQRRVESKATNAPQGEERRVTTDRRESENRSENEQP